MFSKRVLLFVVPLLATGVLQAEDPFLDDPFGDEIFKEMYLMQKEMDKIFERIQQRMEERSKHWSYPARESLIHNERAAGQSALVDKGTYYEYDTRIPESKNNQIDISVEEGVLHLKARVERVRNTKQSDLKMQQQSVSMIQRTEALPQDVDPGSLKSGYQNGMLVLTLQKKKSIRHPVLEVKNKEPPQSMQPEKVKEEERNETDKIKVRMRVPHTSTHV